MKNPLISIIMGTYNPVLSQLKDAINSIISQTWINWEFLIYDDGSASEIQKEIKKMCCLDKRICYLHGEKNRGLAHALNQCIEHASGDYIARMDDDDISVPERLEKQVHFMMEHPEYAWVGTLAKIFDEKGEWGTGSRVEIPQKEDFLKYSPFIHPSVMFRKDIFQKYGLYAEVSETLKCEDYELFMRFFSQGIKGYNMQEILYLYRESRQNIRKRRYIDFQNESVIRRKGFTEFGMHGWKNKLYVLKPYAVYLASIFPFGAQFLRNIRKNGNHMDRTVSSENIEKEYQKRIRIYKKRIEKSRYFYWKNEKQDYLPTDQYVLAPIYHAYVIWILQEALKRGIESLYFLSRDGYLAYKLANKYCESYRLPIECRYFYCSRYTLRVPMYSEDMDGMLQHICRGGLHVTRKKILHRAGLSENEIDELLKKMNMWEKRDELVPYGALTEIMEELRSNEECMKHIYNVSIKKWDYISAYFQQEGMFSEKRIGIVDSGWTGTTQKSIQEIRKRAGCKSEVQGFYFGLFEIPEENELEYYHSFYFSPHKDLRNKVFFSNSFFETVFQANHGTATGYRYENDMIVPVCAEYCDRDDIKRERVQEAVLDLMDTIVEKKRKIEEIDVRYLKKIFSRNIRQFMWNPTKKEIRYYGNFMFSDDLLDDAMQEIAVHLTEEQLKDNHFLSKLLNAYGIRKKYIHESAWYEASAKRERNSALYHRCSYALYKYLSYVRKEIGKKK